LDISLQAHVDRRPSWLRVLDGPSIGRVIAAGVGLAMVVVSLATLMSPAAPSPMATSSTASPQAALPARGVAPSPPEALSAPAQIFAPLSSQQAELINESVPFSATPNPAAQPFRFDAGDSEDRAQAVTCLTAAVYYEAASQSDEGQAAVAQVVLNRVRNPLFPKTICGVVFQGSTLPTGCQFTFTCDGSLRRRPSLSAWLRARHIAEEALNGHVEAAVGEATHYHTTWVVPYWQASVVKVAEIGDHIFYRWTGALGRPVSFERPYAGAEVAPGAIGDLDVDPGAAGANAFLADQRIKPVETTVQVSVATAPTHVQTATISMANLELRGPPAVETTGDLSDNPKVSDQHLAVPTHW
jgi:spore germination cell wall hydrolase CwlJ-like protein